MVALWSELASWISPQNSVAACRGVSVFQLAPLSGVGGARCLEREWGRPGAVS